MKKILLLSFAWFASFVAFATDGVDDNHFRIQGNVFDVQLSDGTEVEATHVQIVVYQDKELFVAFFSGKKGEYEFNLPVGHEYEIAFGGSAFVNQKVYVDSRPVAPRAGGYDLDLDMHLFRIMDGVEFNMLNEPFMRMVFDAETAQLKVDEEHYTERAKELERSLKKIKKEKKA